MYRHIQDAKSDNYKKHVKEALKMTPLKQPERATPGKGGASMFGAALAVARETRAVASLVGWIYRPLQAAV